MGGRGVSSGGSGKVPAGGGIRAITKDGMVFEYRDRENGYITSFTDAEEKSVGGLSINQIAERMKNNGASVEIFTKSQLESLEKKANEERRNKPDYQLGYGVPWGNREYRKVARRNRLTTRMMRRKSR